MDVADNSFHFIVSLKHLLGTFQNNNRFACDKQTIRLVGAHKDNDSLSLTKAATK